MKNTIKDIIDDVLTRLEDPDIGISNTKEARDLIFETGNAETGYRHLEQMGGGPAVSFFQLEANTIKDIWENYIVYRKPLVRQAYELGFVEGEMIYSVMTNIAVAIFFARIYYRRKPGSIPKTLEDRASYWKKHYNTEGGKGTVKHYIEANL
tara:strand:- start:323 stop:778 length:456 start_codon:yes stop_codon:yes gene_type:complete